MTTLGWWEGASLRPRWRYVDVMLWIASRSAEAADLHARDLGWMFREGAAEQGPADAAETMFAQMAREPRVSPARQFRAALLAGGLLGSGVRPNQLERSDIPAASWEHLVLAPYRDRLAALREPQGGSVRPSSTMVAWVAVGILGEDHWDQVLFSRESILRRFPTGGPEPRAIPPPQVVDFRRVKKSDLSDDAMRKMIARAGDARPNHVARELVRHVEGDGAVDVEARIQSVRKLMASAGYDGAGLQRLAES